ncbi:MAG: hypothetical protein Q8Q65_01575 [bacterium]|nr:hypothetical protein [bacterium]
MDNSSSLYHKLKDHAKRSEDKLRVNHPQAVLYLQKQGITPGKLHLHATKLLTSGALAGTLLLSSPVGLIASSIAAPTAKHEELSLVQREQRLSDELLRILPEYPSSLSPGLESKVSNVINSYWGLKAVPELEGNRLNHNYGYIGAEQHLPRFPGDSISKQGSYKEAGITPGKGAWGYISDSKKDMTIDELRTEKYYVAVQTLYLPNWDTDLKRLKEWYKYRKVLVVNPQNGRTVVARIADAGPAKWTGKQFGGSPEVMGYLKMKDGKQKGMVVLYFVDDPDDKISLGPVERYNNYNE